MKYFFYISMLFFSISGLFAQDADSCVSDSTDSIDYTTSAKLTRQTNNSQRVKFGRGYIHFGVNVPSNNFRQAYNNNLSFPDNFTTSSGGLGMKTGYTFEAGGYYFFNKKPVADRYKFGLDVTFISLSYNEGILIPNDDDGKYRFAMVNIKLGPVASMHIIDKLYADVFFKVGYGVSALLTDATLDYVSDNSVNNIDTISYNSEFIFGKAVTSCIGFTIRYSLATFTLSYDFTKPKALFEYTSYTANNQDYGDETRKIPFNFLQLKIGLQF